MRNTGSNIPLYLSAPHPCNYLPGQTSSTLFVDPDAPMDMATYSELLHYGFRRSGKLVYAPRCETCSQCVSVRVPVDEFVARRTHRRVRALNTDVEVREHPAGFNPRHYALYQRYTRARHRDGGMADASTADYLGFLLAPWCNTKLLEFFVGDQLVAVAVTDLPSDGMSAVYTFFEPGMSARSLGTYAILEQIERTRAAGLPYLYLGYWIRDSRKMTYKSGFRPIELWRDGRWRRFGPDDRLRD